MKGLGYDGDTCDVAIIAGGVSLWESEAGNDIAEGAEAFLVVWSSCHDSRSESGGADVDGFALPFSGAGPGNAFAKALFGRGFGYALYVAGFGCLGFGFPVFSRAADTGFIVGGTAGSDASPFGGYFGRRCDCDGHVWIPMLRLYIPVWTLNLYLWMLYAITCGQLGVILGGGIVGVKNY